MADDTFELYDLRVEVVAPQGARTYCGKPGDWFELRGEMLHLPPGQGFSIYSLAALLPLLPAKQRPTHPNDWMSTDAEVACPDPKLSVSFSNHTAPQADLQPRRDHSRAACPRGRMMERRLLAPGYEISRVIRGGWQLAGGHGAIDRDGAVTDLIATADAGITTFDCADIYTGVEEIMGAFRQAYGNARGAEALKRIRVHTKCVPDLDILDRVTKADVAAIIDTSLERLKIDRLDLVQFHWWDYSKPRWRDAAGWLVELQQAGKIDCIGATNFDTTHIRALCGSGVR